MRTLCVMALALIAGCSRNASPAGKAGLPPTGQVRIIPTKVKETAEAFTWQWTIVGDRNWLQAHANGTDLRLSGSYPLNSRSRSGGTQFWKAFVAIEKSRLSGAQYILRLNLRGSTASVAGSSLALDLGAEGALTSAVLAVQTSEATLSLPATVTLATVGRRNLTLKIEE